MNARRYARLAAPALVGLLAGCCSLREMPVPMQQLSFPTAAEPQKNLLVMLRGRFGGPEAFEKAGFVNDVITRDLPFDCVAPNTHMCYFLDESVVERLRTDVILPAKAAGYEHIWLLGASLGGLGCMFYLRSHPEDIDGVIAIAPFLGYGGFIREIKAAGGPQAWQPAVLDEHDYRQVIWLFLKEFEKRQQDYPPVYLGYGERDPYRAGQALFASMLPEERVFHDPGSHLVRTFRRLWHRMLDEGALRPPDAE